MKVPITLLLYFSIILGINCGYSIEEFLEYVIKNGYYDITEQIKNYYGNEIAVDICKELMKQENCDGCEELVYVYIPDNNHSKVRGKEAIPTLEYIIYNPNNLKIYQNRTAEIHYILEEIKNKYNIKK